MKKLFALLLCLAAFSAAADVAFTVNGQAVPASQVSGTIAITTGSTPPPTCTGGQVWNGSACVCPAGTWNGTVCVITPPPITGYELRPINWPSGGNYLNAPIQKVEGATVAAYRINAQAFLNNPARTPGTATIQFYESGSLTVCVSNVPGEFLTSGGLTPCFSVTGPGASRGVYLVALDYQIADSALSAAGGKRLPIQLDGNYYINVKLPDPAGLPSTFWLLYN